jgi:hypothetical protein
VEASTGALPAISGASDFGARTNATSGAFAAVCGRRAAFVWRAAVDFFAMLFSRIFGGVGSLCRVVREITSSIAYRPRRRKRDGTPKRAGLPL